MASANPIDQLPEMQRACLRLVARGRRTKEIAIELGLTPNTVDTYLRSAIRTLGTQDRFEAARRLEAYENGDSQSLRYQSPPIVSATIPDIYPGSLSGRESPSPSVVRDNVAEFGYTRIAARPGWIVRFSDWLGGAWNDLTIPQRLIWMVLGTFIIAATAFLVFAAVESLQTTLLLLSKPN
jgi:DNA-binding CsgD family transcriptional regulator